MTPTRASIRRTVKEVKLITRRWGVVRSKGASLDDVMEGARAEVNQYMVDNGVDSVVEVIVEGKRLTLRRRKEVDV